MLYGLKINPRKIICTDFEWLKSCTCWRKTVQFRETIQRKCDHETVRLHGWNKIKTADPCAHETTAITIMNNIRASIERLDVQSQNDAEESNQFR